MLPAMHAEAGSGAEHAAGIFRNGRDRLEDARAARLLHGSRQAASREQGAGHNDRVFAFRRQLGGNTVTVGGDLSADAQSYSRPAAIATMTLPAWGWNIAATGKRR